MALDSNVMCIYNIYTNGGAGCNIPSWPLEVLRDDANADGTVDAFDALLIQQSLIGILPPGTAIYPRGDADCNQAIQTADAVFVLRSAVGLASPGVCVNTVK